MLHNIREYFDWSRCSFFEKGSSKLKQAPRLNILFLLIWFWFKRESEFENETNFSRRFAESGLLVEEDWCILEKVSNEGNGGDWERKGTSEKRLRHCALNSSVCHPLGAIRTRKLGVIRALPFLRAINGTLGTKLTFRGKDSQHFPETFTEQKNELDILPKLPCSYI